LLYTQSPWCWAQERRRLDLPGIKAEWTETHNGTAKFDLDVAATIGPSGVDCVIEYDTDLFDDTTVVGFADGYRRVLERALTELSSSTVVDQTGGLL